MSKAPKKPVFGDPGDALKHLIEKTDPGKNEPLASGAKDDPAQLRVNTPANPNHSKLSPGQQPAALSTSTDSVSVEKLRVSPSGGVRAKPAAGSSQPTPAVKPVSSNTVSKTQKSGISSHQKEASKATANFRANHNMPKGTQVQHWNKVLSAKETGMSYDRTNKNLSPLQSRNNLPATTLLTSKDGSSGTKYTVHDHVKPNGELSDPKKTYGNEHKFADGYLIPAEEARLKESNPAIDKQDLVEVAGASAKFKITGDPGNASKHLIEKRDLAKGDRLTTDDKVDPAQHRVNSPASSANPKPSSANQRPSASDASAGSLSADKLRVSAPGGAIAKPAAGDTQANPSAPNAGTTAIKPSSPSGGGSDSAPSV